MNLPQDNYSIVLIDHTQMTDRQWNELVSSESVIRVVPFSEDQLYLDIPDSLSVAYSKNEAKRCTCGNIKNIEQDVCIECR